MRRMIPRLGAALLASGICLSALAAVTASLDRTHVALGETVRLLMQNDGDSDRQPDLGPLQQDFEVLGSSHGSSTQIVNGHMSSQTQLTLFLSPRHEGTIQIPPLRWGAEQSAALQLTVGGKASATPAAGDAPAGSAPVSMTATLDQKHPYVQSAVVLTVELVVGAPLSRASLEFAGNSDVLVKQLGEDTQTTESRNGRSYQVIKRQYLLIPQRSGQISLNGPRLDAQVQDSSAPDIDSFFGSAFGQSALSRLMGTTRPLRLSASTIEMNVLARPAAAVGTDWLPAQKVTLQESWRPDSGPLHVGEPLTRHLHLSALGITGAQLPDLAKLMTVPDGIKIYPDQAKNDDRTSNGTMLGSRDQDIALIASQPGHYELPALRLLWWDTGSNTQRQADLPARSLDILPAIGGQTAATAPAAPADTPPGAATPGQASGGGPIAGGLLRPATAADARTWQWTSAGLALLWLGTLLAWWISRRPTAASAQALPPAEPPRTVRLPAGKALKALERACRDNDPQAARRCLLEWAAAYWPQTPARGLQVIARRLGDPRFNEPLAQLDRACYAGADWHGESLAQAFAALPKPAGAEKAGPLIPDLYG